jgi:hypothetical protein
MGFMSGPWQKACIVPALAEQCQPDAALIDCSHAAIVGSRVLRLAYRDESGRAGTREVAPLCLLFWGGKWTLGAWRWLRADFCDFRPDRIDASTSSGEVFVETDGWDLAACSRAVGVGKPDPGCVRYVSGSTCSSRWRRSTLTRLSRLATTDRLILVDDLCWWSSVAPGNPV